ncbi:MAG: hypothetical protein ACOCQ4_00675 [bacterium]
MFDSKKEKLYDVNKNKMTSEKNANAFLNAGFKKSAETLSGNMAKKYSTTGNEFVDQFGKLSNFKVPRKYSDVEKDMSTLWAFNPVLTVKFTLFIRMITRKVILLDGEETNTVQRGAGLKNEGIMRMLWLYQKNQEVFWEVLPLFVSVGSWKDIFQMLSYDLQYHNWDGHVLNWDLIFPLIASGLENNQTTNLVKKYLPQIKANSKCTTVEAQANNMVAKWIASKLFGGNDKKHYQLYRKLKSSGTAHTWQQLISKGKFIEIDFDSVHGRALSQMVSSKFLENQNLSEKYEKWIETKPIAKFTGFVHELFGKYIKNNTWDPSKLKNMKPYQIKTLQKQFDGLVETAKKNAKAHTSLMVVRDTSASMSSTADGTNMACGDIAKALALFFSEMLPDGRFADTWIEFKDSAKLHEWKGETVYEKWNNDQASCIGNTDFQSVIDLFIQIKSQGVPESEFPTGILCISDGEFDSVGGLDETNTSRAFKKLRAAGFSDEYVSQFKMIFWDLRNRYYGSKSSTKFETHGQQKNVYYFSGYEPSIIAFLTGVENQKRDPKNAEELFLDAMDQEILDLVKF